jgi:hemerythrin-like domain-containing protein
MKAKSKKKTAKKKSPTLAKMIKNKIENSILGLGDSLGLGPADIIQAIKEDHKSLREFLSILKDTDEDMEVRKRAYKAFSSLLKSHSSSEEKAVYQATNKFVGRELHVKVAEGYVEHQVANDLMKRIEAAKDPLTWSAHANVLSESVEHHLKEEERDLLPLIRNKAMPSENMEMLAKFISLRGLTQKRLTKKNSGVLKELKE